MDGLVLPGVGAFPRGMANLRELGLDAVLRERFAQGVPMLGICLGMQLAFDSSTELHGAQGLGLVAGAVRVLQTRGARLPHIGWSVTQRRAPHAADGGVAGRVRVLPRALVRAVPADEATVVATASHGETFVTAVSHGSFHGVQFHPEKSSQQGLRVLANFARICSRRAAGALA